MADRYNCFRARRRSSRCDVVPRAARTASADHQGIRMKSNWLLWVAVFIPAGILLLTRHLVAPPLAMAGEDPPPNELVRLSMTGDVWFDKKRNAVVVDG